MFGLWRLAIQLHTFLCISLDIPCDHQSRDSTVNSRMIKIAIWDPDARRSQQKMWLFFRLRRVFCCCCRFTCLNRCERPRRIRENIFIALIGGEVKTRSWNYYSRKFAKPVYMFYPFKCRAVLDQSKTVVINIYKGKLSRLMEFCLRLIRTFLCFII